MATLRLAPVLGTLVVLTGLAGCGAYTNVPAQVHVTHIEPATVGVVFSGTNPPQFTNPTVTITGEPGSIGTNLWKANIAYKVGTETAEKAMFLTDSAISLRVEPSMLKSYGTSGNSSTAPEFVLGSGKAVMPVVNQKILDYAKSTDPKPGSLNAIVTLTGGDDALWPTNVTFQIPIVFSGQ